VKKIDQAVRAYGSVVKDLALRNIGTLTLARPRPVISRTELKIRVRELTARGIDRRAARELVLFDAIYDAALRRG
jgi:hypothetical protein